MNDTETGANKSAFDEPCAPIAEADFCALYFSNESPLWKRIASYAGRWLHDEPEGEDIAQETAIRVLQAIRNGKQIDRPGIFQYCIVTANRLVGERLTEVRKFREFRELAQLVARPFPDLETRLFARQVLSQFPERHRNVMVLTALGLEDSEIAEELELTDNNVRQIRHRVRSKFSKKPPTPEALDNQSV